MVYDDNRDYEDEQESQDDEYLQDPWDEDASQDQEADEQDKLVWRRLGIVMFLDWLTGHLHV